MVSKNGLMLGYRMRDGGSQWDDMILLTGESPSFDAEGIGAGNTVTSIFNANHEVTDISGLTDGELMNGFMQAIWGAVWGHYYVAFHGSGAHANFRGTVIDGQDIVNAGGLAGWVADQGVTVFQAWSKAFNLDIWMMAKGSHDSSYSGLPAGSPEGDFPSYCNVGATVILRWDGVDSVDVYLPEAEAWFSASDNSITSQSALQTWLENIYPDDDYNFAYHVTSGEICVEHVQRDVGNGNFTFSVDLQDQIIIEESAEAWVVRKKSFRNEW